MSTKYGQWIYAHNLAGMRYYRCSTCSDNNVETFAAEVEVSWWKYCPKCGAKMFTFTKERAEKNEIFD